MRLSISLIASAISIFVTFSEASAGCICQCVDGHMQPLCTNAIDLPPICPPTICDHGSVDRAD